ncbi:MAG: UbiX family flavin prenyltransferase, partial [Desulfovibrio sp.]|nr:UbiX family flavin prenyltransferase [Desulfovibrio sp.]
AAGPASGSWWKQGDALVVVPCSMSTLGAVASGCGTNLIHRCCDVALKERRQLLMITRESPLSLIQLRNMAALTEAGAIIMPFSPGFYFQPASLDDLLGNFCQRVFDVLGISHNGQVWGAS